MARNYKRKAVLKGAQNNDNKNAYTKEQHLRYSHDHQKFSHLLTPTLVIITKRKSQIRNRHREKG